MSTKEIVIDGVTYIRKPVKRVFKSGEWVRVYSKAKTGSYGSNGPKAGDFGRVSKVSGAYNEVTVDFGVLGAPCKTWNFNSRSGDKTLTNNPSTSLLRHCRKA